MNNLLSLDLKFSKKVTTAQIKSLGKLIGDALWLLEMEMIKKSGSKLYVQKINMLIDFYANQKKTNYFCCYTFHPNKG